MRYFCLLLFVFLLPTVAVAAEGESCSVDNDCNDGVFCNGVESCFANRCQAGSAPCEYRWCNEHDRRCDVGCAEPDADGDGVDSIACGGTDCDDSDPYRYPGNYEICDSANHDEDCDPSTFGDLDADGDGYISAMCGR